MKLQRIFISSQRLSAAFGKFPEVSPENEDLLICERACRSFNVLNHVEDLRASRRKLDTRLVFSVTVFYKESRLPKPVKQITENLLILRELLFFWCHFVCARKGKSNQ
jgi:hypothetical protein